MYYVTIYPEIEVIPDNLRQVMPLCGLSYMKFLHSNPQYEITNKLRLITIPFVTSRRRSTSQEVIPNHTLAATLTAST